jgi:hypothetical protein
MEWESAKLYVWLAATAAFDNLGKKLFIAK